MSAKYICDIQECNEDAYPMTFQAKQALIKLNPHLVLLGVIKPEHQILRGGEK